MSEPTTEAGRALLDYVIEERWALLRGETVKLGDDDAALAGILAIEAEARATEREAVRERVQALRNPYDEGDEHTTEAMLAIGFEKGRAAVLGEQP